MTERAKFVRWLDATFPVPDTPHDPTPTLVESVKMAMSELPPPPPTPADAARVPERHGMTADEIREACDMIEDASELLDECLDESLRAENGRLVLCDSLNTTAARLRALAGWMDRQGGAIPRFVCIYCGTEYLGPLTELSHGCPRPSQWEHDGDVIDTRCGCPLVLSPSTPRAAPPQPPEA